MILGFRHQIVSLNPSVIFQLQPYFTSRDMGPWQSIGELNVTLVNVLSSSRSNDELQNEVTGTVCEVIFVVC